MTQQALDSEERFLRLVFALLMARLFMGGAYYCSIALEWWQARTWCRDLWLVACGYTVGTFVLQFCVHACLVIALISAACLLFGLVLVVWNWLRRRWR